MDFPGWTFLLGMQLSVATCQNFSDRSGHGWWDKDCAKLHYDAIAYGEMRTCETSVSEDWYCRPVRISVAEDNTPINHRAHG